VKGKVPITLQKVLARIIILSLGILINCDHDRFGIVYSIPAEATRELSNALSSSCLAQSCY